MKQRLLCALACLCACSSATLYRHNAPDLEATIVDGDRDYVYVETDDDRVVRVARKQITEIDHPGNVDAVVGGVLTFVGGSLIAAGSQSHNLGGDIAAVLGVIYAVPGAILLAEGLYRWQRSSGAAEDNGTHLPLFVRKPDLGMRPAPPLVQPPSAMVEIPVSLPVPTTPQQR